MFGSITLDVAVGLFFLYLFLSLVCSVINEWIANVCALRAKTLESGLKKLLHYPDDKGLTERIYSHPLITVFIPEGRIKKPAYIPPRRFASALLDALSAGGPAPGPAGIEGIRNTVAKISDCHESTRRALLALIDEAGTSVDRARENIEQWFNESMERVSAWYKRKVQVIILCVAVVTSTMLNADTFMFAGELWNNAALRSSVVAMAESLSTKTAPEDREHLLGELGSVARDLQHSPLPLGWSTTPGDPRIPPSTVYGWLVKIAGILMTTSAVTLGAPFWFDLLKKILALRSVAAKGNTPRAANP